MPRNVIFNGFDTLPIGPNSFQLALLSLRKQDLNCPGYLLNVLCTFNFRPVSRGSNFTPAVPNDKNFQKLLNFFVLTHFWPMFSTVFKGYKMGKLARSRLILFLVKKIHPGLTFVTFDLSTCSKDFLNYVCQVKDDLKNLKDFIENT